MTWLATLARDVSSDDTRLPLSAVMTSQRGSNLVVIDAAGTMEIVEVTGVGGTDLFVLRGRMGTPQAPHLAGVAIERYSAFTSASVTVVGGAHPDLATHDGLGLATDAELATHAATPHGGSIPAGIVAMWAGLLANIPSGWALCDGLNGTPDLRSKFVKGAAAGQNPGATGGSATASYTPTGTNSAPTLTMNAYTPAGTNSAPAFTGSAATSTATSGGTPAGTNSAPAFTGNAVTSSAVSAGTPAGTNDAPAFTGNAVTSSAVSGGTPAGTNSAPAFTGNAVTAASTTTGTKLVTANTSTGVSPITTATGTVAAPVFTGSALGTHTHSTTATGTVAAPTFTGSAMGTHTHSTTATGSVAAPTFTGSALATHTHNVTATGTVAAPTFTGTQATLTGSVAAPVFTGSQASIATEPAYYALAFIQKL